MSFFSIDGKIMKLESGFPKRKVNSLTFQTSGVQFPINTIQNHCEMYFESKEPNTVTVGFSDGVFQTYNFGAFGDVYRLGFTNDNQATGNIPANCLAPNHVYQDSSVDSRFITFTFLNALDISNIYSTRVLFEGEYPSEIGAFVNLKFFTCVWARFLNKIPESISNCKELSEISFQNNSQNKLSKIPDSFFELKKLRVFKAFGAFDLNDPISSNFFKINQWESLHELDLRNCEISTLVPEIIELNNSLRTLRLQDNNFPFMPSEIEQLSNLNVLNYSKKSATPDFFIDFSQLNSLSILQIYGDFDLVNIPTKWLGLLSLVQISTQISFTPTDTKFDEFINHFYTLCTTNGSITNNSGQFATRPNRFRNISWGHGTLSFTGTKQAPAGYVQGVSNGTPANEGEKVYVLQNQYGHTITHGTPL